MHQETLAGRLGVSVATISSWERDIHPPKADNLRGLSRALNTSCDYFIHGARSVKSAGTVMELPILTWDSAINWRPNYHPPAGDIIGWHTCALKLSSEAFCVIAPDSSMHSTSGFCIPAGSTVVIDPCIEAAPNQIVFVIFPQTKTATIKQLVEDGPVRYLQPTNPQFRAISLIEPHKITGVILQVIQERLSI